MSEEIIKVLDDLGSRFGLAIDWSSQNVMPYLEDLMGRFIAYKNAEAIIAIIVMTICIAICAFFIKKAINWRKSSSFNEWYDGGTFWAITILFAIFILVFAIVLIVATHDHYTKKENKQINENDSPTISNRIEKEETTEINEKTSETK